MKLKLAVLSERTPGMTLTATEFGADCKQVCASVNVMFVLAVFALELPTGYTVNDAVPVDEEVVCMLVATRLVLLNEATDVLAIVAVTAMGGPGSETLNV